MISSVFKVLEAGLGLWKSKESRKYLDKVIKLKREWYEEYNKETSDHAILDNIERELLILCESFSSQAGIKNADNK